MDIVTAILLTLFVISISMFLWKYCQKPQMSGPYPLRPLTKTGKTTAERYIYEWKDRKKILRNPFSVAAAREGGPFDAIVIGSGMGGFTVAVLLSKMGKKVLVLEQNSQIGGCCHTFNKKGYEFDVGIHYVGNMYKGHYDRFMIDQLTDGLLEWQEMSTQFDRVVLGGSNVDSDPIFIPIGKSLRDSEAAITKAFPEEKAAIKEFFVTVKKKDEEFSQYVIIKFLPKWLVSLLNTLGLINVFSSYFRTINENLADYLKKLTSNPSLRTTLSYCWGDYGTAPKNGSVHLHAGLWSHFSRGAYYPVGGASEITMTMMNIVKAAGGKIYGNARVKDIICNENGKAVGVRVALKADKSKDSAANGVSSAPTTADVYAPIIVSGAGVLNTSLMLPANIRQTSTLPKAVDVGPGYGAISVFVGLANSAEELGIECNNFWSFPHGKTMDTDEALMKYEKFTSLDELIDSNEPFPLFFASFPSMKDPIWSGRNPDKAMTTVAIITLAPWKWFEPWLNTKVKKRGDEYQSLKKPIGMKLWEQLCTIMPKSFEAAANVELMEIGTPLTNNHYLGATQGEIYGLDHSTARFGLDVANATRPDIGIKGLYLSGQDVMTCGFAGAMVGGYMCTSEIIGKNLLLDAMRIAKKGF